MSQLTKEQQNDIYRRKVALGEVPGEMTGYASIDKPWLKYYDEAVLHLEIPSGSMYDYLHDCNKDYGSDIARATGDGATGDGVFRLFVCPLWLPG